MNPDPVITREEFRKLFLSLSDDKKNEIIELLEQLTKEQSDKLEVGDEQ